MLAEFSGRVSSIFLFFKTGDSLTAALKILKSSLIFIPLLDFMKMNNDLGKNKSFVRPCELAVIAHRSSITYILRGKINSRAPLPPS